MKEELVDAIYTEAEKISEDVLRLVGFVPDVDGGGFTGTVSLPLVGAALGLAAARALAAATDKEFVDWIVAVAKERSNTSACELKMN